MKNNIVQFNRPITFIFCLGSLKCWIREIRNEYSLLSLTWDEQKLVCCRIDPTQAKDYAYTLISEALRQVPMSLPDEEPLDIEYANDPCFLDDIFNVTWNAILNVIRNAIENDITNHTNIKRDSWCERLIKLDKDAQCLADSYPVRTKQEWKEFLLASVPTTKAEPSEEDSTVVSDANEEAPKRGRKKPTE